MADPSIPSPRRRAAGACAWSLAIAMLAGPGWAADGVALAREGRCSAAIPLLSADPSTASDVAAASLLGRCLSRSGEYAEAVTWLTRARELAPDDADLALDQGVALYNLSDRPAARRALAQAEGAGCARPELPLYQGLIALDDSEDERAAVLFSRARDLAGDAVEPVASYYEGLALSRNGSPDAARSALERVRDEWPETEWAEAADKALSRLGERDLRRWASLRVGFEWDDNAVLRGRGVRLPDEIPGDSDERLVWTLSAGADLVRTDEWLVSGALTYQGNEHDSLDDFDIHYPSLLLWADRSITPDWSLRVLGSAGYAWVGGDPFLATHRAEASLFRVDDGGGVTRLTARFDRDNYLFENASIPDSGTPACLLAFSPCSPVGVDEERERNRDGNQWSAGIDHTRPVWNDRIEVTAGIRWVRFSARGQEYTYQGPVLRASVFAPLGPDWDLRAAAAWASRSFRHPSTFPEPIDPLTATQLANGQAYRLRATDRTEHETRVEVTIGRKIGEQGRLELQWHYQDNDSTTSVFDFDRHRIGAYFIVGFGD